MATPKPNDNNSCIEAGILDNALVIIAVLEKKGRVITWNHAAETITGYSRDEVVGSDEIWKKLYPDTDYRDSLTEKIESILSTRNYFENFETTIRTRAGKSRIILWNTKKILDRDIPRTITVGLDITEPRKADLFRESVIDNANILIAVIDKGNVTIWNKAAETITGYSRDEVIGKGDVWTWLYPDAGYRRTITRQITDIITKNRYFENFETTIVPKSGPKRIISWNTRQIGTGETRQDIAIGLDITARRQAEDALISYITEMAMRLKGPVEIIRDNLSDVAQLVRAGKLDPNDIALVLDGQVRNAHQIARNVKEFQQAIAEKNKEIPDAYRKFLNGE
ncbi:MAG: PAS domain-containing protein [Methanoregula sp.]|jgi:PAS domain S-box-containing protein